MHRFTSKIKTMAAAGIGAALLAASPAMAVPALQLDIGGGVYVNSPSDPFVNGETTVAQSSAFTLYAYAKIGDEAEILADKYRVSMAVLPSLDVAGAADLGSFTFHQVASPNNAAPAAPSVVLNPLNGGDLNTIEVTGEMNYGTPPFETILDQNDLGSHSVFDTFYVEHEFMFDTAQRSGEYDVELNTGIGPQALGAKNMFYIAFNVDVSNLSPGYAIHFDLYNTKLKDKPQPDVAIDMFAPFSHDAQSWEGDGPPPIFIQPVATPEPVTGMLSLMGIGALGLSLKRRRIG